MYIIGAKAILHEIYERLINLSWTKTLSPDTESKTNCKTKAFINT